MAARMALSWALFILGALQSITSPDAILMRLEGSMNAVQGAMLSLAMVLSGAACSAQDTAIQIRQIERNAQLSAKVPMPPSEVAVGHAYGPLTESSSSAGFVYVPPAVKSPRTFSTGFFLLNGLHLGMAVLDVELTQHCIANHHCVEGNPMMPSSHAGQLGVEFGLVGYGTFISYKLKRRESKLWVLAPAIGVAAHTVGVATGIANR